MPEEIKTEGNNGVQVIEKKETIETVSMNPQVETGSTANKLNDILGRIERGADAKEAIKEVNQRQEPKPQDKAPEPKTEDKPKEVSDLDKGLQDRLKSKQEKQDEVTRESLRKQNETPPANAEAKPEDEVDASELAVLPQDKPKTAKRIQALLHKIEAITNLEATTKKELLDRDNKLAEFQKQLEAAKSVDPKTNDEIKKQLDELAMLRRRYELDNDPEVKSKYDSRVESSELAIKDILKKAGAGEGLMKLVEEDGGWMKFAESNRVIKLQDGNVTAAELADTVLQSMSLTNRKAIESAMIDVANTKRDKQRFFEEEQKKANEYFTKREQERSQQTEAQKKQAEEGQKAIDEWHKSVLEKDETFKEREIPATATKEQKAAIEEYNKYTRDLKSVLKKTLTVSSREDMLDVVLDSVKYWAERRKTSQLQAELDKVKADLKAKSDEVDKVKNAGRSVPRGTSISSIATPTNTEPKKAIGLESAFDALSAGHKLDRQGNILSSLDE